ncbi:hypothetical protein AAH095_17345, partial [Phocaeicola vulgatus]|uniref:hypothetical protein n=1 Tax=Phocaeicola vulgatus TaxID=821 RepID=UPI0039B556C5
LPSATIPISSQEHTDGQHADNHLNLITYRSSQGKTIMYFVHISQLARCIIGFSLCFYIEYLYFCNKNRLVGFLW